MAASTRGLHPSRCRTAAATSGLALAAALQLFGALPASAQEGTPKPDPPPGVRRAAITVGLGPTFGGLIGATAELYLARGRISLLAGAGGNPKMFMIVGTESAHSAFALAARGYLGGRNRRVFLEASWSELATTSAGTLGGTFEVIAEYYGPGLSIGYHYTTDGGFTTLFAAGAGWNLDRRRTETIFNVGFGYTWRR